MIKKFATALAATLLAISASPADAASHSPAKPRTVTVTKALRGVAVCTGKVVARRDVAPCVALYLRPAAWTEHHHVFTPAGPALVAECLDQYRGVELHYCLTQPQD